MEQTNKGNFAKKPQLFEIRTERLEKFLRMPGKVPDIIIAQECKLVLGAFYGSLPKFFWYTLKFEIKTKYLILKYRIFGYPGEGEPIKN